MTEKEKMELGLWYDANYDAELNQERLKSDTLCFELNQTSPQDEEKRVGLIDQLIPEHGEGLVILSPLYVDYIGHTKIGKQCFFNHNTYFMNCLPITFGDHCFVGPNCGFYTANHPLIAEERNAGLERAEEIVVGNNVWFGGNCVVLPGVHIGDNTVIGAGSLVTKDIPSGVLAMGSPCRVVRPITDDDRILHLYSKE